MNGHLLTAMELLDINCTINEIVQILNDVPFDATKAREKIGEVNSKHPENVSIYNFFYRSPNTTGSVSISEADDNCLRADLEWKKYYLEAKRSGKTVEEIRKELNTLGGTVR